MTDPEDCLAALWAMDEPPTNDSAFVVAVIERASWRQLALEVMGFIPPGVVAVLTALLAGPELIRAGGGAAPVLNSPAVAIAAACLTLVASAWFVIAEEGEATRD